MGYKYHCLNPISEVGIQNFTEEYVPSSAEKADAILVRPCMTWSSGRN